MAQRRKIANQAVVNNGEVDGLESIFKKSAAELAKLHYLSLNKKVAFDAGIKTSYERAYEWIQLQMKDGKPFTQSDMCAYLQDKLSDNMLHMQQLVEQFQMANGQQQTEVSNDNATDSPYHDQEMETVS